MKKTKENLFYLKIFFIVKFVFVFFFEFKNLIAKKKTSEFS